VLIATVPAVVIYEPETISGVPIVTVTPVRFKVKLFNAPALAKNRLLPVMAPDPPTIKSEVEVPINLLALDKVIAPFNVSTLPAPIDTTPNGEAPPPNVIVPETVVDCDNVTDGVAIAPLNMFAKFKLLTVAGNKAPVVWATEALKVKLVLFVPELFKFKVPVYPAGKTPFTPAAFVIFMVAPPSKLTVPLPTAAEENKAVPVVTIELAAMLTTPPTPKVYVVTAFSDTPVVVLLLSVRMPVKGPVLPVPPAPSMASPIVIDDTPFENE